MGVGKQTLQAVASHPGGPHAGLALALVLAQQMAVAQGPPVVDALAGLQHIMQGLGIGQAQVQAQARQRVHAVGGVTGQHPRMAVAVLARPLRGTGHLQGPGAALTGEGQAAQLVVAGMVQGLFKLGCRHGLQLGGPCRAERPHQGRLLALRAAHGQQRQDIELAVVVVEPLEGLALVGHAALHPSGQGVLVVGQDLVGDAQVVATAAVAAFAHHGEAGTGWFSQPGDQGLVLNGLGQLGLEHRHIHDPTQAIGGGCGQLHLRPAIAPDPHALHRGGVLGIGPAAQALQQGFGGGIQGKSAHIGCGLGGSVDQAHPQAQTCQLQGQALTDHTGTSDTYIESSFHGGRF